MNENLTIRVPHGERAKIEALIKRNYPKFKTISAVVRQALTEFLAKESSA